MEKARKNGKSWKIKTWDENEYSGIYYLRGKNRDLAIKLGRPIAYDKAAILAVSYFHLAHNRNDVTIASYILATEKNNLLRDN